MPTIIIKVDLECCRCHAKIKKVLDRIRDKGEFVIDDIEYDDEKKNRVIVSGPFDADKLADKLCCKACSIIKEIEIVEPSKKEELQPPATEKKVKPPPPPAAKAKKKRPPAPPPPPPSKVIEVPYPCPYPYPFPAWPSGCCCHHGHGGCHCCSCTRQDPPPEPAPQYLMLPSYPCGGYMMVCEEEPSGACTMT